MADSSSSRSSLPATTVVDVMYTSEGRSCYEGPNDSSPLASEVASAATATLAGWASTAEAGAAKAADTAAAFAASLTNQMGHLSLSGYGGPQPSTGQYAYPAAVSSSHTAHAQHHLHQHGNITGLSNDEDEWKNAWDEDDEESDDEGGDGDDDVLGRLGGPLAVVGSAIPSGGNGKSSRLTGATIGSMPVASGGRAQPFRPFIDMGHSSSSSAGTMQRPPGIPSGGAAAAAAVASLKGAQYVPIPYGHGVSEPLPMGPSFSPLGNMINKEGSHLHSNVMTVSHPPETEEEVLTREADLILTRGDNGVQWDTSFARSANVGEGGKALMVAEEDEKPSVSMFFPLLRVLGKGSFGKVSSDLYGMRKFCSDCLLLLIIGTRGNLGLWRFSPVQKDCF